jgi:hypothetical protein
MSKIYFLVFISLAIHFNLFSQQVASFENVTLNSTGFNNGSDNSGGFISEGLSFFNFYDSQFNYWTGFSASNLIDTTTVGYTNQYSAFAGSAFSGNKFAVAYASDPIFVRNSEPNKIKKLLSFRYTNNSYTALSMRNGDAFSKKFGGPTGNDPDFFKFKVFNYRNGIATDSAEFFLADYRFENNSQDYIQKNWKLGTVNFSQPFDSLAFKLYSSDFNNFGILTPAYFCLDDVLVDVQTSTAKLLSSGLRSYPNPAKDHLILESTEPIEFVTIFGIDGKEAGQIKIQESGRIELGQLIPGVYILATDKGHRIRFEKL